MTHDRTKDPRVTSTHGVEPGHETESAPGPIGPNGQHSSYWVLTAAERSKGFVRPFRNKYVHSGNGGPQHPTRELTADEKERYAAFGYVLFEAYPDDGARTGNYWTQERLDRAKACGSVTRMGNALSETYAVDPSFYGATFCVGCKAHFPVAEFLWDGTDETVGS